MRLEQSGPAPMARWCPPMRARPRRGGRYQHALRHGLRRGLRDATTHIHRGDRHLDLAGIGIGGGEALGQQAEPVQREAKAATARAPAQQLVGDGRGHRHEGDAQSQVGHRAEAGERGQQQRVHRGQDDKEASPAAGVGRVEARHVGRRQPLASLGAGDGHVLRAVVAEDAPITRQAGDTHNVGRQQGALDQALGQALRQRRLDQRIAPGQQQRDGGEDDQADQQADCHQAQRRDQRNRPDLARLGQHR